MQNDSAGDLPEGTPTPPGTGPDRDGVFTQQFRNQPVAARVPPGVGKGTFVTGALVQEGPHEFVIDFLQALSRPPQVAARVVLAPPVLEALVRTFGENFTKFTQTYGPPAPLPKPQNQRRPSIQEIYENFKLPDELWSGAYANSVLVGHGPAEFFMDFITGFYPTAAVSCRIFFAAQQAPRILETFRLSFQQYQRKQTGPPAPPPESPESK